uniref:Uncharacterized protein n=1 Tax=Rhizophora mucronata TaxID=61149 RepID=A0A2P2LNF1_RHIMU
MSDLQVPPYTMRMQLPCSALSDFSLLTLLACADLFMCPCSYAGVCDSAPTGLCTCTIYVCAHTAVHDCLCPLMVMLIQYRFL